jgi:hypothetical protein
MGWPVVQSSIPVTTITLEQLRRRGYEAMLTVYRKMALLSGICNAAWNFRKFAISCFYLFSIFFSILRNGARGFPRSRSIGSRAGYSYNLLGNF